MSDIKEDTGNHNDTIPDIGALSSMLSAMKSSDGKSEPATGDILSGLLSNPEILSKLPTMIETVKPLLQNFSSPAKEASLDLPKKELGNNDRRTALLLALKPYLSPHRCDAVDYIIKISGITKLLR